MLGAYIIIIFLTVDKYDPEGVLKLKKYKDGYDHSVSAVIGW